MNIIVAGGCGLVGRQIVAALKHEKNIGDHVWSLDKDQDADIVCDLSLDWEVKWLDKFVNDFNIWINATYPEDPLVHFKVFLESTEKVAHIMSSKPRDGFHILLLSSIYGVVGANPYLYTGTDVTPPSLGYQAAKGAIITLTKAIATQYGTHGIRCNCIVLGGVFDSQDWYFIKKYRQMTPDRTKNGMLTAIEAGKQIANIALNFPDMTGAIVTIDRGYTAQ